MKVTVMGTAAAYPGAGEACSGFLVEQGGNKLLVDCGTGVLGNLQKHMNLVNVTTIVITHMHADHFIDLIPYRYALVYGFDNLPATKPKLYLPPGGTKAINDVVSTFNETDNFFADAFEIFEYEADGQLHLDDLELHFIPVHHFIPSYGVTIFNERRIAYTSDSGPCDGLMRVAREADLLICNIGACLENGKIAVWGHLTPAQAGVLAKDAQVKRLVLSHLWPGCNRAQSLRKAADSFDGPIELAETLGTYLL